MDLKILYELLGIGMIENYNYIGTSLNGSIQEAKSKGKTLFSSFKNIYINKGDRTSYWVGHLKLKELYINGFFERKQMIEDMKAKLTESPKQTSNTDNYTVSEEENVDEAFTAEAKDRNDIEIDLKEEQKTQAYKQTIDIDIENINTFEKINKLYTNQWRKIYKIIEPDFKKKSDIFPDELKNVRILHIQPLIFQLR